MKFASRYIFVVMLSVIGWFTMSGCMSSSSGTPIEKDKLSRISKGVTTRSEMEAMFGAPTSLIIMPDGSGKRMATWHHSQTDAHANGKSWIPIVGPWIGGAEATSQNQNLQVTYNKAEVVEDFVYSGGTTTGDSSAWGSHTQTTADTPVTTH